VYACREWLASSRALSLDRTAVPQLADVNVRLAESGFRMLPVAGLISGRGFLSAMAEGVFLATQYMRHHTIPFYTPEPDVIHELVGHAASLFHPDVVALSRRFGEAARRANETTMKKLELVYWYTLEFGLVREDGALRTYGAGVLSSFGEMERMTTEAEIRPLDFDDARAALTTRPGISRSSTSRPPSGDGAGRLRLARDALSDSSRPYHALRSGSSAASPEGCSCRSSDRTCRTLRSTGTSGP